MNRNSAFCLERIGAARCRCVQERSFERTPLELMDYGKAIRLARTARGFSQKGLASRSGINTSYVSLIETGKRVPSARMIGRISKALQVPGYLLALLGADADELTHLSREQAALVGADLLTVLTTDPDSD